MAEIPDGGSSGGGSTTSICTVNPSDNVSIINNLISRISDIEKFLSQLVGADVHADNLSELATNIGNILNGTITLPGDGNSPYGTGGSIPVPDGFTGTVISGNVITTWTDGVVSFQVIPSSGITVGAGGGVTKYLVIQPASTSLSGSGLNATANLSTIIWSAGSAFGTSGLATSRIDILEDGIYHISVNMLTAVRTTSGSSFMNVRVRDTSDTTVKEVQNLFGQNASPANNNNQTFQTAFSFVALAGYDVTITFNNTSGALFNIADSIASIEKIG